MINAEATFNDLGVDAGIGLLLLERLEVNIEELADPRRFQQLKSVIDFLKPFPPDTQRFYITKTTRGKAIDKLGHMFEYTHLLQDKTRMSDELRILDEERNALGPDADPMLREDVRNRAVNIKKSLAMVNKEIAIYEK